MKILLLTHKFYPEIGGIEINSEILANHFTALGARVHLVTWSFDDSKQSFPFKVIRKPSLFELWKEHQWADLVFENNPVLRLAWPVFFLKKKHVVAVRTWIKKQQYDNDFRQRLKLHWLKNANAVIAVSEPVRQQTFPGAVVIGNPYRDRLFKIYNSEKRNKDFVFLGRLVSDKGADLAIQLIYLLNKEKSEGAKKRTLTIIGDGPEREKLEKMVAYKKMEEFVFFTGFLNGKKLAEELNQYKYILIPSRWEEPFGNIALEGMACGCLPIVSDGGGLPDAVGDAGIVFKRNDMDSFLMKVKGLLESPQAEIDIRAKMKNQLLEHAPEVVSKKYFEVLEKVRV